MLRVCSQCGLEKPITGFAMLKRSKDGRRGYCKCCGRKYRDKYRETHVAELTEAARLVDFLVMGKLANGHHGGESKERTWITGFGVYR